MLELALYEGFQMGPTRRRVEDGGVATKSPSPFLVYLSSRPMEWRNCPVYFLSLFLCLGRFGIFPNLSRV